MERGLHIQPNMKWDGRKETPLIITGYSDATYQTCPDTCHGVSGCTTTLLGVAVITRSVMQQTVKLSVTEAELESAISTVQDMCFVKNILESMELTVQLPMILYVDNKAVEDIVNGWTVGGRTRHIANKQAFLREMKERGELRVIYRKGTDMCSDLFTKNLTGTLFNKHIKFYTIDYTPRWENPERESVGSDTMARSLPTTTGTSQDTNNKTINSDKEPVKTKDSPDL